MTTFFPSVVVHLTFKFDESLHIQNTAAPQSNDDAVQTPLQTTPATAVQSPQPLITQHGEQNSTFIYGRVPSKCTIEKAGYRQAGKFSCEFQFKDIPLDPRTVSGCSVEIHAGAVPADRFAAGMRNANAAPRASVITGRVNGKIDYSTLVMTGIVDKWHVNHTSTGSVISMEGRDLVGPLLDYPVTTDPKGEQIVNLIDWGQPIDAVINQLLSYLPTAAQGYHCTVLPAEWPNGVVPSPYADSIVPRHRKGANGKRKGGRGTVKSGSEVHFWDLIINACNLCGAVPYFRGYELMVRPSRNLFTQQNAGDDVMNPAPFTSPGAGGGTVVGHRRGIDAASGQIIDPALSVRRMIYGRDVESMSFDRTFGGYQKRRIIRCIGVNDDSKGRGTERFITAEWPPNDPATPPRARNTRVSPGGNETSAEVITPDPIHGITDVNRLREIAKAYYEEVGRNEIGGTCSTVNLSSFGGDNADPDLLRLKPGDAIEFGVDARALASTPPLVSTLTDFNRDSFQDTVNRVTELIGNADLARVIVATARGEVASLPNFFRVATVRFGWDTQSGIKIDFDFQNYINIELETLAQTPGVAPRKTGVATRRHVHRNAPIAATLAEYEQLSSLPDANHNNNLNYTPTSTGRADLPIFGGANTSTPGGRITTEEYRDDGEFSKQARLAQEQRSGWRY